MSKRADSPQSEWNEFTEAEIIRLADLLADSAADLEDDGCDGCPDSVVMWKLQRAFRRAVHPSGVCSIGIYATGLTTTTTAPEKQGANK